MQYRQLRAALVVVLTIAALGAAGASMSSGSGGGEDVGIGDGEGVGVGSGDDGFFSIDVDEQAPEYTDDGDWIGYVFAFVTVGALTYLVAVVALAIFRNDWSELFELLRRTVIMLAIGLGIAVAMYLLVQLLQSLAGGGGGGGVGGDATGVGTGEDDAAGVDLPIPPLFLLLGACGVAVFVYLRSAADSSDDADPDPDQPDPEPEPIAPETKPVGSVDRESGASSGAAPPADNEVYRSWLALAEAGDANPRRDSPAEVTRSAVEAGVDEAVAGEITDLFEEVRYGGASPDGDRERRAATAREKLPGEPQ